MGGALAGACNPAPTTSVVFDNDYPATAKDAPVVYLAYWQSVLFEGPVFPGASSAPQSTVAASPNTAYVVLAPGWDPEGGAPPSSFVLLQSRSGFGVGLGGTLHIPVDDSTFMGNCASASFLTQAQADFISQMVFAHVDAGADAEVHSTSFTYDAATCTATVAAADAGTP